MVTSKDIQIQRLENVERYSTVLGLHARLAVVGLGIHTIGGAWIRSFRILSHARWKEGPWDKTVQL